MEKFDAHAAFEAEFGSLDNESKENTDLATFLLSETSAIMMKALRLSIRQDELKNLMEEAVKKGEEPDNKVAKEFVENAHQNARFIGALDAYKKIAEKFLK